MRHLNLPIEGENDPVPFKVLWGNKVEAAFATAEEAEKYKRKNLGKSYQIMKGNRLISGKPTKTIFRGKISYQINE